MKTSFSTSNLRSSAGSVRREFSGGSVNKRPPIQINPPSSSESKYTTILERAHKEGSNTLIEGIHLVPSYVELDNKDFMYVITVDSKRDLEARFYERARYSKRQAEYYIEHIDYIMETLWRWPGNAVFL